VKTFVVSAAMAGAMMSNTAHAGPITRLANVHIDGGTAAGWTDLNCEANIYKSEYTNRKIFYSSFRDAGHSEQIASAYARADASGENTYTETFADAFTRWNSSTSSPCGIATTECEAHQPVAAAVQAPAVQPPRMRRAGLRKVGFRR
jgi:hypothetical protein